MRRPSPPRLASSTSSPKLTPRTRGLLVLSLSLLASGCSWFGLKVEPRATTAHKPSNVAAYFSVADGETPLTELTERSFVVYENEQALDSAQVDQRLLDLDAVAAHRTLLLVDVSAEATPADRLRLGQAVAAFADVIRPLQPITVVAFDGGAKLRPVADLPKGGEAPVSPKQLVAVAPRDPSRDFNGAVIEALQLLDRRLSQTQKPIRVGTLVVFASGADLAGRTLEDDLYRAVDQSSNFVLGVGLREPPRVLEQVGKHGVVTAKSKQALPIAFEEAAYRVRALYRSQYVVSYCSPARAGFRRVRIEARYTDAKGEDKTGELTTDFDSTGFTSGCDSNKPRFGLPSPGAVPVAAPQPAGSSASGSAGDEGPVVPPPDRPGYTP